LKDGTIEQSALETGTKIIVKNLFSKTPARLNYLKKPRTEYIKIYEYIRSIALIYPEIGFEFINDDTQVCMYRPSNRYEERIIQIL
jgi:DNA mismatch repair protein MutL